MTAEVLKVRNVNHALIEGLWKLRTSGVRENSRNGPVLVMPGPFITQYTHPNERVLFQPLRDANPVFHLMESLWMLAGRADVAFLLPFNGRFSEYAEADGVQHGAYGRRWRSWFGHDQILQIVDRLKHNPEDRRCVLEMWDANDNATFKRDVPCNTHAYFDCRGGKLNMTVCNRSNDAVWGAYGANAVHFSILQEVMAHEIGVPVGVYTQFSNNFHAYTEVPQIAALLEGLPTEADCPYTHGQIKPTPLLRRGETISDIFMDCEKLVEGYATFKTKFVKYIAAPLMEAYLNRKQGLHWHLNDSAKHSDWGVAFQQWAARRDNKEQA